MFDRLQDQAGQEKSETEHRNGGETLALREAADHVLGAYGADLGQAGDCTTVWLGMSFCENCNARGCILKTVVNWNVASKPLFGGGR